MRSMLKTLAALFIAGWFLFDGASSAQACHGLLCPKCAHRAPRQYGYGYGPANPSMPVYGTYYWYPPVVYRNPTTKINSEVTKSEPNEKSDQKEITGDRIRVVLASDTKTVSSTPTTSSLEETLKKFMAGQESTNKQFTETSKQLSETNKQLNETMKQIEGKTVNLEAGIEEIKKRLATIESEKKK